MLADGVLGYKKLKNFRTKSLFEQFCGNCRQRDEHPIGAKQAVGGKHVDVRVEENPHKTPCVPLSRSTTHSTR